MSGKKESQKQDAPEENRLEKIMKERFGDPQFGNIMGKIVDEMFKSVDKRPDNTPDPKKD